MLLKTHIIEAATSLYATKQRTLLALAGIVIGIGSVIAMISVGVIYRNESIKHFQALGTDLLTIRKIRNRNERNNATIRLADATELAVQTPSIIASAPWLTTFGEFVYAGKPVSGGKILGVTASFADLEKLHPSAGRFISDLDFRRYYCVVGDQVAQAMRNAGVRQVVGETIKLQGRLYTIVGVLQHTTVKRNFNANSSAFIPISTAQRSFRQAELQDIIARTRPDIHYTVAEADVKTYFSRRSADLQVEVVSAQQLIEQVQKQMRLITLLLGVVGSISLIVGGVGVMNVMLASVSERRKEIGIRRALGARRADIRGQFLTESIILSLTGGLLGIMVGIGGSYVACRLTEWEFLVSAASILLGIGVASVVGIFFGLYPAHQAARLDPINALRAE